jgi:hypothetical protein
MAHEKTHFDVWPGRGVVLVALALIACGSSNAEPPVSAASDAGASIDSSASMEATVVEREAAPAIPALAFDPDAPLVYQSLTDISLPDAEQGQPYAQVIRVRAGTGVAPYHLSISELIAKGLVAVIDRNDTVDTAVLVAGIATELGSTSLRIDAVDGSGTKLSASFAIRVVEPRATILSAVLPNARAGVAGYAATLQAQGGIPPLVWSASGLPTGMSIDPNSGALGGVPDAASGDHDVSFTVTVTDSITDASTHAPNARPSSTKMQMHVDPGYQVNIYKLLADSACTFCHGDVGGDRYYKPRIAGIPTPPAGMENASGLIGQHPGGTAGDAHETVCLPTMTYVIPGDPEGSLLFEKISGTLDHPPPCGSCMPYQGSCNTEPTLSAGARDLVRHWILSLPPMPTEKDLE